LYAFTYRQQGRKDYRLFLLLLIYDSNLVFEARQQNPNNRKEAMILRVSGIYKALNHMDSNINDYWLKLSILPELNQHKKTGIEL
jgi:hypothetical protein